MRRNDRRNVVWPSHHHLANSHHAASSTHVRTAVSFITKPLRLMVFQPSRNGRRVCPDSPGVRKCLKSNDLR